MTEQSFSDYVGGLPSATALNPSDTVYLRQGGVSKSASATLLATHDFDNVAALQAASILPTVNSIRTSGYYTAGDGGGAQYVVAPVQSADQGRLQSADGRWWQYVPDSRGVNARAFGAKADGVDATPFLGAAGAYYGAVHITGTDSTQFIQDAIDFAIRNNIPTIYLSAGKYVVSKTLHLGWGTTFMTVTMEGDNQPYTSDLSCTAIIFSATDGSQCLNISGGRNSGVRRISFIYPANLYWVMNNVWVVRGGNLTTNASTATSSNVLHFASVPSVNIVPTLTISGTGIPAGATVVSRTSTTVTMSANATGSGVASGALISFDDPSFFQWVLPSNPLSWTNPALTTALARRAPIAAITVDAFAGSQPSPHYPDITTYPAWTGLSGQYNRNAYSSGVHVRECSFQGWPVAFALGVNTDAQGDFAVITDCFIATGTYGISINNTQSRNVDVHNITFQFLHTVLDNINFGGSSSGEWGGPISNMSGGQCYQIFDFGGTSGPLEINNVYSEGGLRRLGRWLNYNQLKLSRWLLSFDDSPVGMERGLIETYVYGAEITFEGCTITNMWGIQQLTYGLTNKTVLGTSNYFTSCARQFPDVSTPGYQAANFGGGFIMNGGSTYPASYNKVRGSSLADVLIPGGPVQAAWSDTIASNATNVNYLHLWREGTESFRDFLGRKWDIIQVTPSYTPVKGSGSIGRGHISGVSQTGAVVTLTISSALTSTQGDNHWAVVVGDILVDQLTGTLYVVTNKVATTYTLAQQNNYDNYPGTGFVDRSVTGWTPTSPGTPSNIATSGGDLKLIRTNQRFSQAVYFGDFTSGSPNISNIHAGDLDGSTIATFLTPGTLLFCPGLQNISGIEQPIAGEFPVDHSTYIGTVTNGTSTSNPGSLTLTRNAIATGRYPIAPIAIRTGAVSTAEVSSTGSSSFPTRAAAIAATLSPLTQTITTGGYAVAGDGGGALYKRTSSLVYPSYGFTSSDGAHWEYVPEAAGWNARVAGVVANQSTDDSPNIMNALLPFQNPDIILGGGGVGGALLLPAGVMACHSPIIVAGSFGPGIRMIGQGGWNGGAVSTTFQWWGTSTYPSMFIIYGSNSSIFEHICFDGYGPGNTKLINTVHYTSDNTIGNFGQILLTGAITAGANRTFACSLPVSGGAPNTTPGIGVGASIGIGLGTANFEIVYVSSVTSNAFTADCVNNHSVGEKVGRSPPTNNNYFKCCSFATNLPFVDGLSSAILVGNGIQQTVQAAQLQIYDCQVMGAQQTATVTVSATGGSTVVTDPGHKMLPNTPMQLYDQTDILPSPLSHWVTYYILPIDANTYHIALTPGGSPVTSSGSQSGAHIRLVQAYAGVRIIVGGNIKNFFMSNSQFVATQYGIAGESMSGSCEMLYPTFAGCQVADMMMNGASNVHIVSAESESSGQAFLIGVGGIGGIGATLEQCSYQSGIPADNVVISWAGSLTLIGNIFMNGAGGGPTLGQVPRIRGSDLSNFGPDEFYSSSIMSIGNYYANAGPGIPVFYDGSNNPMDTGGDFSTARKWVVQSFNDYGDNGKMLPTVGFIQSNTAMLRNSIGGGLSGNYTPGLKYTSMGALTEGCSTVVIQYTDLQNASTSKLINIFRMPLQTKITSIVADVTTPFAGINGTLTLKIGDSSLLDAFMLTFDAKVKVAKGLVNADLGVNLNSATMKTLDGHCADWAGGGFINVQAVTSGPGMLSDLTAGSVTVYVTSKRYV